jgi:hypothetical protein
MRIFKTVSAALVLAFVAVQVPQWVTGQVELDQSSCRDKKTC